MEKILDTVRRDVAGKLWWPRLPLVVWFAVIIRNHLEDPRYASLWDGLNLGIHEVGHVLFSPLGEWMGVAGGTIAQLAAPVVAAVLFARQKDWFAVTVGVFWLGTNFVDVAVYMADARDLLLPLVSTGGGEIIHDWNYLLDSVGLLGRDHALAAGVRKLGVITMLAGMGSGAAVLLMMRDGKSGVAAGGSADADPSELARDEARGDPKNSDHPLQ